MRGGEEVAVAEVFVPGAGVEFEKVVIGRVAEIALGGS